MCDFNNKDIDLNRSIAEFQVCYITGIYSTGQKKGQEKTENEIITIIVPSLDKDYVQNYIQEYCRKKNMKLIESDIQLLSGKRDFEFNCQICGELSINLDPTNQKFCSKYCQNK
ncbi:hypothetical protein DM455_06340 [Legionella pneumophila]|uniref:hypothetical protein n=1 Tax=Legionella pneumophila TaxID=446 RepID=UPI000D7D0E1C|nr:hypothetical protein [Legionella pneumophila]PYB45019.1 hypothetical protein DM454_06620 [Legionella pneumophila]PYB51659.1 hypothetical protein DM456_06920 [Legionella pneumophila]PYB63863.1 hypothetical protein DM455_06340 [Legionella pneumophila]TID60550.1 hypothetical protein DIZ40_06560 [Legionella pneumophila]TID61663.1 hypothetical protein DIZ38_05145 [Legionella pneumophila]